MRGGGFGGARVRGTDENRGQGYPEEPRAEAEAGAGVSCRGEPLGTGHWERSQQGHWARDWGPGSSGVPLPHQNLAEPGRGECFGALWNHCVSDYLREVLASWFCRCPPHTSLSAWWAPQLDNRGAPGVGTLGAQSRSWIPAGAGAAETRRPAESPGPSGSPRADVRSACVRSGLGARRGPPA